MSQSLHLMKLKTMSNKPDKRKHTDWFQAMIEEVEAIMVESRFSSQETIIRGKHAIGKAIAENETEAEAKEICALVAGELGVSKRTIQQAHQFYKLDPKLKVLEGGKDISWRKILKSLQEPKEKVEVSPVIEHMWVGKPLSECKKRELIECIKYLVIQMENLPRFKSEEAYELDAIKL